MYKWVWLGSRFQAVISPTLNTFELNSLKPGDLLFWTGTYAIDRDPPVTHVMIYLGINRHSNKRVVVGSSEGRRFNEKSHGSRHRANRRRAGVPGNQHMGFIETTLDGIVGSVIGSLLARIFSKPADGAFFHPAGFLLSIVGAMVLLFGRPRRFLQTTSSENREALRQALKSYCLSMLILLDPTGIAFSSGPSVSSFFEP
jgi:uncharacterized membrane protein YeaQ/YmgE (transglycosylase-associated protein family)